MEEEFLLSFMECKENVKTFPSSFRLVPHNVSGIQLTMWGTNLNEDSYFLKKKEFLLQKNSSIQEQSLKISILVQFQKKKFFEMKMKNWIE